jgi:hypothetical protein
VERLCLATRIWWAAALAALVSMLAPAAGEAKLPLESDADETAPGVTVTGLGFAASKPDAVRRAVGDARRRAAEIGRALGIELAGVEEVELPELAQFGTQRACRRHRQRSNGCRPPRLTAAAATTTFSIAGGADGEGVERSVHVHGTASARVRPRNSDRSRSIKRAVLAVRRALAPEAAASARRDAKTAARAADLRLGAIVSVAEAAPYYGSVFYDSALGSFGPGRFCGIVNKPVVCRHPETGVPGVVRRVPQRRCFVPSPYRVQLAIEYEAT